MKKFFLLLAVVFIAVSCIDIKTTKTEVKRMSEVRDVKGFKSIAVEGSPIVHYKQDSVWSVKVYASEEMMKYVKTEVINGRLVVSMKKNSPLPQSYTLKIGDRLITSGNGNVDVVVSSPDIVGISVRGSGDFLAMGNIDTDKLDVRLLGSGDIKCSDVLCDTIHTELEGSGDILVSKVDAFYSSVTLIGSGDIKLSQQNVGNTNILLKGSGDISVNCANCGSVDCVLKGSGDIRLAGEVRSLKKETLGSGDIHFPDEER